MLSVSRAHWRDVETSVQMYLESTHNSSAGEGESTNTAKTESTTAAHHNQ